jgi:hypothetical protein
MQKFYYGKIIHIDLECKQRKLGSKNNFIGKYKEYKLGNSHPKNIILNLINSN